ncbi:sugar transferase [Aliiroseovarius crassostreae]|uniref:sugar transferase n=1 Tax=Aliiroseovarius crassostreae TaxID=154981 RepID=UPI003C7A3048
MKDFGYQFQPYAEIDSAKPRPAFRFYRDFSKRVLDFAVAIFLLPLLVPVIGLFILMIKRDGGPGLYAQERVGLNGKRFQCWKLRTMVQDAELILEDLCATDPLIAREWAKNQKLADDPRITPIGRFLRATSLDELPQIFNVLIGDMSFVGPRPFMTSQEFLYKNAGGQAYFHMRPGITGPWQVSGRNETGFLDRIRFDQMYLEQQSLPKDLMLMLRTAGVVVRQTGR